MQYKKTASQLRCGAFLRASLYIIIIHIITVICELILASMILGTYKCVVLIYDNNPIDLWHKNCIDYIMAQKLHGLYYGIIIACIFCVNIPHDIKSLKIFHKQVHIFP